MYDEEASEKETQIPEAYTENDCERETVRSCGACLWVVLGLCIVSWSLASFQFGSADAPKWARNVLWVSLAHHHPDWVEEFKNKPPPPPFFSDGNPTSYFDLAKSKAQELLG